MQCLNTKIKEEDIAGDTYVNDSSSHLSAAAQPKVILSPRIEIHRIVKHHSADMAQIGNANAASRDGEIAYEQNASPIIDNITDAAGPLCGADRMQPPPPSLPQHQFVSPANNCAVLHYREHRTETTSMPQQRVHVIKDGRFYSTTTTTASTSSPSSNGTASATTAGAAAAATGPTATSKNRFID